MMFDYLRSVSIEFIAAFFAFLSAILVNKVWDNKQNKERRKKIIENLEEELTYINNGLEGYKEKLTPILTPTWDALQNSGEALELIDCAFYNQMEIAYKRIKNKNDELILWKKHIDVEGINEIIKDNKKLIEEIDNYRTKYKLNL